MLVAHSNIDVLLETLLFIIDSKISTFLLSAVCVINSSIKQADFHLIFWTYLLAIMLHIIFAAMKMPKNETQIECEI